MLGDGEVFQAWSGGDGDDLSGSEIERQPAGRGVFRQHLDDVRPDGASDVNSPDMAHEQMPPIARWSYKYVAAALPPQAGTCDTLLGPPGASLWRMLAANDDTAGRVHQRPDPRPARSCRHRRWTAGEVIELIADGDFVVKATEPLLMTQGIDCEPSLSLAISADKLLTDVTFAVLPAFDQMVAIARMQSEHRLARRRRPIDDALFAPAGGGYEVARVLLADCPPSKLVCTHRLQGRFGMTLRGMDVLASYALTAPVVERLHTTPTRPA